MVFKEFCRSHQSILKILLSIFIVLIILIIVFVGYTYVSNCCYTLAERISTPDEINRCFTSRGVYCFENSQGCWDSDLVFLHETGANISCAQILGFEPQNSLWNCEKSRWYTETEYKQIISGKLTVSCGVSDSCLKGKRLEILQIKCHAGTPYLDLTVLNVCKNPMSMIPFDVIVYNSAGRVTSLTTVAVNETYLSDSTKWKLAQFPGGYTDEVTITLNGTFVDGEYYPRILLRFPEVSYELETSCQAN